MSKLKKIFLIVAILVAAGFLLWGASWLFQYYQYRTGPEYQAQKYIKEMEKKYREDAYGGSTPEETLNLFIDALKKGDIDLASKYFVIDKQEEWKRKLDESKKVGNIDKFVSLLEKINTKENGKELLKDSYQFTYSLNNDTPWIIDLAINPFTNKWKIESL
jgi:hypothetical protein